MSAPERTKVADPYRLRTPCRNCPFRSDVTPFLRGDRAAEIAHAIANGGTFPCHKTTTAVDDDDEDFGRMERTAKSQECAGALIVQERSGAINQALRIAERLGMYDRDRLDLDAPVYASLEEFVRAYRVAEDGGESDLVHCDVSGPECEDPAGYMTGSGAMGNVDAPSTDPASSCVACGHTMCDACTSPTEDPDGPLCVTCDEGDPE